MLQGTWITLYIDSQAVEYMLMRASSRSEDLNRLVCCFWRMASRLKLTVWVAGVRSESNIADAPSRRDWSLPKDWKRAMMKSIPVDDIQY